MGIRFDVKQTVRDYVKVGDEYKNVDVEQRYRCETFEDLKELLLTLVDYSTGTVKFSVSKEEVDD